jgi:hypothetical protein
MAGCRGADSRGLVTTEMQSIAKRIEDRCVERESERRALALAHRDRHEVDEALRELRLRHQEGRIAFLGELRKAQGAELELHLLHVEKRNRSKENRRWVELDSGDGERLNEMMVSWRGELSMMAAAVVKRESFLLRIRGMIETKQSAKRNRQRKKQLLKEQNDALKQRIDQIAQASDRAQKEIVLLEEEDAARKAHVQRVADEVRSQLAKVRVLRNAAACSRLWIASHFAFWLSRTCLEH